MADTTFETPVVATKLLTNIKAREGFAAESTVRLGNQMQHLEMVFDMTQLCPCIQAYKLGFWC